LRRNNYTAVESIFHFGGIGGGREVGYNRPAVPYAIAPNPARPRFLVTLGALAVGVAASLGQLLPETNAPGMAERLTNVSRQLTIGRPRPLITTGRQLLDLPITEAQRRYPARMRGVITYFDAQYKVMFVQDETAGFWIYKTFRETNYYAGQLVELKGVTDAVFGPALRPS
jgi:hypothetical protein